MNLLRTSHTPFRHCSVLFLWGILCFVQCVCGEDAPDGSATNRPAAQLRAATQVDGQGVFLSQIIEVPSDLPRLRLCDAPQFGKAMLLKRAEVAEMAAVARLDQSLTNWTGPGVVRISRRSRALADKEALQLLTSVLQKEFVKDQGELELRFAQPLAAINVPDEPFAIKVFDLPTSGVSSALIVRFELQTAQGETVGSWQASLHAKVWREVWVSASGIKRGELVRAANLTQQRRDMLLCWEPLAEFAPDDPSLEFVAPVPAGTPIWARLLRPRAIVRRGQSLLAKVQDGALLIILKVEALEDGAAGQTIRIRNPLSQRDLRGKVLDEQNILVFL